MLEFTKDCKTILARIVINIHSRHFIDDVMDNVIVVVIDVVVNVVIDNVIVIR